MNDAEARKLLAVDETASRRELKSAYRRALKAWHPDLFTPNTSSHADAISRTQRINEAYRLLGGTSGWQAGAGPLHPVQEWYQKEAQRINRTETVIIWGTVILMVLVVIIVGLIR